MARTIKIIFFVAVLFPTGPAFADCPFVGRWHYDRIRYEGIERPRPNPTLQMYFEFDGSGISRLYWTRDGEKVFCERKSQYQCSPQEIYQIVTWVNPNNSIECHSDPDMQLGIQTRTLYRITKGELATDFNLGESKITYIWRNVPIP